tara:strand:- start:75 stop:380 length:306 start_codon:yes stop_codon:yes gene_type:complete
MDSLLNTLPEVLEDKIYRMSHEMSLRIVLNDYMYLINNLRINYNNLDDSVRFIKIIQNYMLSRTPERYWNKLANDYNIEDYKTLILMKRHEQYWETYGSKW